jgi:hypothetical protein
MTQEDIIRMAREAGLHLYVNDLTEEPYVLIVERFANLVAAAEREECAQIVEQYCGAWNDQGYALAQAIRARGEK